MLKQKHWIWLTSAAVAALLTVGCGAGDGVEESICPPAASSENTMVSQTPETTAAPQPPEAAITETELYQAEGVTVTATKLEEGILGPSIHIAVSNDTDRNLIITTQRLSINGYMMPTSGLYCDVAAGKRADDELMLTASELEQSGIDTIGEVEFYLHIADAESYDTVTDSDLITLKTSASGTFAQNIDDSGQVVYDSGDIRVICRGLRKDTFWDGTVVFYMENLSDRPVTVYGENVSVNGYMVDVSLWADLRANTRILDGMYLLDMDNPELEDVSGVETMEFTLRIADGNDWSEIDTTAPITLHF